MQQIIKNASKYINIQFSKVKSHQKGSESKLSFEAKLNNKADELAVWIKNTVHGPTPKTTVEDGMGICLLNEQGIILKDCQQFVYEKINGDKTKDYLMKKNKWTLETISLIEWTGVQLVLESLPNIQQRIGQVQLMHHWQNIGEQKQLFGRSKKTIHNSDAEVQTIKDKQICLLGKCPFGCGQQEERMHFMECGNTIAMKKRKLLIDKVRTTMEHYDVHESIKMYLLWGVKWNPGKPVPSLITVGSRSVDKHIQKAYTEQTTIGWKNVQRGFLSKNWSLAQEVYDRQKQRQPKSWNKLFVKWMMDISWEMWKERNQALHGQNIQEGQQKRLNMLRELVTTLYQCAKKVEHMNVITKN